MTNESILPAESCSSMAEVRAAVDRLDVEIVTLLARRFGYMRAAARIKPERSMVRDEMRKAQVIVNAAVEGSRQGLPQAFVEQLWEIIVEACIAYEMKVFDEPPS